MRSGTIVECVHCGMSTRPFSLAPSRLIRYQDVVVVAPIHRDST